MLRLSSSSSTSVESTATTLEVMSLIPENSQPQQYLSDDEELKCGMPSNSTQIGVSKSTAPIHSVPPHVVSDASEWLENAMWLKQIANKNVENICVKDIRKLSELKTELGALWNHRQELNEWNLISAAIDYTYPSNKKLTDIDEDEYHRIIPNHPMPYKELKYCISHAAYSYFMPIIGIPANLAIKKSDCELPFTSRSKVNGVANPGYFIAIDHENNYILLCIRGTSTPGDVITDLDAFPVVGSFADKKYYVHPGIYDSAMNLHEEVIGRIKKYKKNYPNYKILVTGHSLGAGVCSLLCLLWNTMNIFDDEEDDAKSFACYSFASPLVIDEDGMTASLQYDNMVSVAVTTDVVTRLSGKTVLTLVERVNIIKAYDDSAALVKNICAARKISDTKRAFEEKLGKRERELIEALRSADGGRFGRGLKVLYPCGKLLWFMPEFDVKESLRYQTLLRQTYHECDGYFVTHLLRIIPGIVRDFYVVNNNEILQPLNSTINDRLEFTQLVWNGHESLHAHFPGRYTNNFNIDIIDIFKMSQLYYIISMALYPFMWIPGAETLLICFIQILMFLPVIFFILTQLVWNISGHMVHYKFFYFYLFLFEFIGSLFDKKKKQKKGCNCSHIQVQ